MASARLRVQAVRPLLLLLFVVGLCTARAARFRSQRPSEEQKQDAFREPNHDVAPKVDCTEEDPAKGPRQNASVYANRDPLECLTKEARAKFATQTAGHTHGKKNGKKAELSSGGEELEFAVGKKNISSSSSGSDTKECHQCYTSCDSEDEAMDQCISAYYMTCDSGKRALTFCRCEQGGWDYPYLNPGGRPAGQFSWKCCFSHQCLPE